MDWRAWAGVGFGIYVATVWLLRRRRIEELRKETNVWKINRNVSGVELLGESITAMELNGLLRFVRCGWGGARRGTELSSVFWLGRVYAVPSISWLLRSTGGFNTDCMRRYQE